MPFDFHEIYMLSNPTGNYMPVKQIAFGVRKSPDDEEGYQFLTNNDVDGGHSISGKIIHDADGVIVFEDDKQQSDDGKPVDWRFEPLTLKNWLEMGTEGSMIGFDQLRTQFKSDEDVRGFYLRDWLDDFDWWKENPEGAKT
jgi:hypothetical protein